MRQGVDDDQPSRPAGPASGWLDRLAADGVPHEVWDGGHFAAARTRPGPGTGTGVSTC